MAEESELANVPQEELTQDDESYLDDLLDHKHDGEGEIESEPVVEDSSPDPTPEPEGEGEPAESATVDTSSADEDPPTPDPSDDALAAEKARADGLQKEMGKIRAQLRQYKAEQKQREQLEQLQRQQAGVTAPAPEEEAKTGQIPVVVSPDGQQVYVDPEAVEGLIEQRAAAIVDERLRPDPMQAAMAENQAMAQHFVAANPEVNGPVYQEAAQADDFLSTSLQAIMAQGTQIQSIPEAIQVLKDSGVAETAQQYFPWLAPVFDEFVTVYGMNNATLKHGLLGRLAAGRSAPAAPETPQPPANQGQPLVDVSKAPQALARKGGARVGAHQKPDEKELDALEAEFAADPTALSFTDEKMARMKELGARLGRDGYDSAAR